MQSFLLLLLGFAILGACIWFLHRIQLRRTVENADLTAPLDTLDEAPLPDFAGTARQSVSVAAVETPDAESPTTPVPISPPEPAAVAAGVSDDAPATDNWLAHIRSLRDSNQLDAALAASRAQFPKTQAFQQAAIILRQQIREALEKFQPAEALLRELYHTAALADLFRTSSSHKPHDPLAALAAVRGHTFQYAELGYLRLKLLNKSDVRALEQLWAAPAMHRHTEDLLGEEWLTWCRKP